MADSLEDLAGQIEADPEVLRATVDEYNRDCARGHDELFAKDRRYLRPLVGPRYYAVRGRTVFLGTMGGIKVTRSSKWSTRRTTSSPASTPAVSTAACTATATP